MVGVYITENELAGLNGLFSGERASRFAVTGRRLLAISCNRRLRQSITKSEGLLVLFVDIAILCIQFRQAARLLDALPVILRLFIKRRPVLAVEHQQNVQMIF